MLSRAKIKLLSIYQYIKGVYSCHRAVPLGMRVRTLLVYNYGNEYIKESAKDSDDKIAVLGRALYQEYIKGSQRVVLNRLMGWTHGARFLNVFHNVAFAIGLIRTGLCAIVDYIDAYAQKKSSGLQKLQVENSTPAKIVKWFLTIVISIIEVPVFIFGSKLIGDLGDMLCLDHLGRCKKTSLNEKSAAYVPSADPVSQRINHPLHAFTEQKAASTGRTIEMLPAAQLTPNQPLAMVPTSSPTSFPASSEQKSVKEIIALPPIAFSARDFSAPDQPKLIAPPNSAAPSPRSLDRMLGVSNQLRIALLATDASFGIKRTTTTIHHHSARRAKGDDAIFRSPGNGKHSRRRRSLSFDAAAAATTLKELQIPLPHNPTPAQQPPTLR